MHYITRNLTKGAAAAVTGQWARFSAGIRLLAIVAAIVAGCDAGGGTTVPEVTGGIRLDQSSVQLDEGATSRLRVLIQENGQTRDVGGSGQVSWLVRDPEIATVRDGLVTGVRAGVTQVTASIAGKQAAHAEVVVLAVPGSVEILSGDRQTGVVGERLATPIRVRVLDRRGAPLSGAQVEFVALTSSGSVSRTHVTPDAEGVAQTEWTLGTRAGAQAVDVRIAGRNLLAGAVSATAAPGPVTEVRVTPADALTNPGGRVRYSAEALDQYGNGVPDARLTWQTPDAAVASVGADGVARALSTGEASIEAVYVAPASAGLTSNAPPENRGKGKLRSKDSGVPQQVMDLRVSAVSTNSVTLSFTEVNDGFGAAADYQIRYAATPIGGGFSSATVVSQGSCASPVSGGSIGATRTCRVDGLQSARSYDFQMVAFNGTLGVDAVIGPESNVATATTSADLAPAVLERTGGNNQSGPVSAQLPSPLAVRVKDALGQPMANVAVRWTVTSGGGLVSSAQTSTNSLGVAEVYWTLGSVAGTQTVRATVNALTSDFTATAQSVAPTVASVVVTPSTANVARGSTLQLLGEARDAQGNAIAGVTLTWLSSDASKATVSSSGQVSGVATGTATIRAVSGSVEGSAQITVDDSNAAPHWVEILAGNRQTGTVNSKLGTPLRVRINDGYGKPMPSTAVSWTVIKGGGSLSATQTTTDGQGITEVDWTLGSVVGMQEVRVTAGSAWAGFEATGEAGTGRPATVTTLATDSAGTDRIWVRFTEVDDGTGNPAHYSLRYHVSPIGWNWGTAVEASEGSCASLQGTSIGAVRRCWVGGLQSGVTYDVQLVAWRTDASGARVFSESLSNVTTGTTRAPSQGTLSISPSSVALQSLGATQQLSVTARDGSGAVVSSPGVTWTSSNTSIVTVDGNGMLTARGVGSALITAAAACCVSSQIQVTVQQTVASLSVDPTSANLTRGQSMRLNATARDANGNVIGGTQITWQSSNSGVASVSADGTVSGTAAGSASITASSSGRSAAASVSVQEASTPTGTAWLNEPASSTTAIDEAFNSLQLGSQPAGNWAYASNWWSGPVSIVSGNGPKSGPSALRYVWPAGTSGGYAPTRAVSESANLNFSSSYYIGLWVRWSKPWTNHPSGVNKIYYWGEAGARQAGHATSQFYLNRRGNVIDMTLQWGQSYSTQPGGSSSQRNVPNAYVGEQRLASTSVDDGLWHLIEMRADASTDGQPNGRVRVWVDGILQFDLSNIRWAPSGTSRFYGINLDPVWGGVGGTKATTEWIDMDHVRTSGR